jgi:hypothetical protein
MGLQLLAMITTKVYAGTNAAAAAAAAAAHRTAPAG